jgi:3-methylfumaryl-CoA hydratase
MWAGGRFEFHRPLQIGDGARRVSRIADVRLKQGRSGPLVFVTVRHEIRNQQGVALTEEQDIVYRGSGGPAPPIAVADAPEWEREIRPDDVLLFRYSALTFNSHRIHYDRRFATGVEGYPGLVVHGPLIATLLLDLLRCNLPEANVAKFSFRAVSPLFDTASFRICGKPEGDSVRLWAKSENGGLAMDATAMVGRAEACPAPGKARRQGRKPRVCSSCLRPAREGEVAGSTYQHTDPRPHGRG